MCDLGPSKRQNHSKKLRHNEKLRLPRILTNGISALIVSLNLIVIGSVAPNVVFVEILIDREMLADNSFLD